MAGLKKEISTHDSRRTFATLAYKEWNLDIETIKNQPATGQTKSFTSCVLRAKKTHNLSGNASLVFRLSAPVCSKVS